MQSLHLFRIILQCNVFIFSRPASFLQKSSCRVSSEKNILNSSVEQSGVTEVEWSGVEMISEAYDIFVYHHKVALCLALCLIFR